METNVLLNLVHVAQDQVWVDKVNETHMTSRLCPWVSTFHPDKLPCVLEGAFHNGAFNAGVKMVFTDNSAWMVRFPRFGMVCEDYTDEKVAMEVSALNIIHDTTTIPVPKVRAWGYASSNSLGLGPFIMMDFIDGVGLSSLLQDPKAEKSSRVVREDISDSDIEIIYRQLANFLLQLFKLDFDQIGDRTEGFATTTEYFQYVIGQDWKQLAHQPNSTVGFNHAQTQFVAFKVLESLIPEFINEKYDRGKFKLICDDLGLANLIVRGAEDLTVVGLVDLEWSYIGPAQLFGSAPWWLLQDRPRNSEWNCDDTELPRIGSRY